MLNVIMQNVITLRGIVLSVIMLSGIMLKGIMLSIIMLSVIMLNVVILIAVAPYSSERLLALPPSSLLECKWLTVTKTHQLTTANYDRKKL